MTGFFAEEVFRFAHPPNRRRRENALSRATRASEEEEEGRIDQWLELAERAFGKEDAIATAKQARREAAKVSGLYFLLRLAAANGCDQSESSCANGEGPVTDASTQGRRKPSKTLPLTLPKTRSP